MSANVRESIARAVRRVRALLRRDALDRDAQDEMRFHVDMEAADLARMNGLSAEEARRQALVAFGGTTRFMQHHREARGTGWIGETWQDIRYAIRSLRRSPGFTLSSVLVLGLGIGATTAAFSAVNAVLLDPEYDDLVVVFMQFSPTNRGTLSVVDFRAIEEQQRSFSAVGALNWGDATLMVGSEPQRVRAGYATSGFFAAMQARMVEGRAPLPREDVPGAPPAAVVSYERARALGGAAAAIGQTIVLDDRPHTVVGVLPEEVRDLAGVRAEVWASLQLKPPTRRGPFGLRVVGRVKDGVSPEAANSDLAAISERIFPLWSKGFQNDGAHMVAIPLRTALIGDSRPMIRAFAAAVALVLLIAVANVASLMLVRAIGRSREVSLRGVLGASRARLMRLMITESLVLSTIGAGAGIALGAAGLRALIAYGPRMPHLASAQLDARAVIFATIVALVAGVIVGAYPTTLLLRPDSSGGNQGSNRTVGAGRQTHAVRSAFVVSQFAFALPLLAVAGLLLNSFLRLQDVDPGFDPTRLLTARVSLPSTRYGADSLVARYWSQAVPRLAEIDGVQAVGLGSSMPPDDHGDSYNNFDLIDRPVPAGTSQHIAPWITVNSEYFSALGLRLLDGRGFMPADTGSAPVVVVSQSWARRYYPDGTAIGRTMVSGGCTECPPTTVVGIVSDARYEGLSGHADAVYGPLTEGRPRDLYIFLRMSSLSPGLRSRVVGALRPIDPMLPLDDIASMEDRLYSSIAQPRNWTVLLGGFAAAALVLAAFGIFGMLSHAVSTRRREIGLRMALGARQQSVVQLIVRRGLIHAIVGIAIGMALALAATRAVAASLYDVSATDPATLSAVALVLLAVATFACWLPARRAAAIDPAETLRSD